MKTQRLPQVLKWLSIIIACPIILFLLLAVTIYIPPIQNWVVDRTASYLSSKTGTRINIDNIRLAFPLDLSVNGMQAIQASDTLLAARNLRLKVKLLPLLHSIVDVEGIELRDASVNTKSFISNTQIIGVIGELVADPPATYSLLTQQIDVSKLRLSDADIRVLLCDTAKQDTTSPPSKMVISLGDARLNNTKLYLQMPGDSMRIGADIGRGRINSLLLSLGPGRYSARHIQLDSSQISYDIPYAAYSKGLDTNHLLLSGLSLKADTFSYQDGRIRIGISQLACREQCGLQLQGLNGQLTLDGEGIQLPTIHIKTPYTDLQACVRLPWQSVGDPCRGEMDVRASGKVGRKDVLLLTGNSAKSLLHYYPDVPLRLKGHIIGNMERLTVRQLDVNLQGVAHLTARGKITHLMSDRSRSLDLNYRLRTGHLGYYSKLIPDGVKIPAQLLLGGNFKMHGSQLLTRSTLHSGRGSLTINGQIDYQTLAYDLDIIARRFPLRTYMPSLPLTPLTARAKAKGRGFDMLARTTRLSAQAHIQQLSYDTLPLSHTQIQANLVGGNLQAYIKADNDMLQANTQIAALLSKHQVSASVQGYIDDLSLKYFSAAADSMHLMSHIDIKGLYVLDGSHIQAKGCLQYLNFVTPSQGYMADDVDFSFLSRKDSTFAKLLNGDLSAYLSSDQNVYHLTDGLSKCVDHLIKGIKSADIDEDRLKDFLPDMVLNISASRQNAVSKLLRINGYDFDNLHLDFRTNPSDGVNGQLSVDKFRTGSLLLDQTTARIYQDSTGIRVAGKIANTDKHNPNRFVASLNGELLKNGFSVQSLFKDEKGKTGLDIGLKGELASTGGITFHLFPETSTIAYRKFKVNTDNYLTLTQDDHISADINLLADDRTGLKIIAPKSDSIDDITLSLSRINLDELSTVLPYIPDLGGLLSGDLHIIRQDKQVSASGAIDVNDFRYEGYQMGDFGADLVYLPKSSTVHYLNAMILSQGKEVADFDGTYLSQGNGSLDATLTLQQFPCRLLNSFMPSDGSVALDGRVAGALSISGPTDKLIFDGNLQPDSIHVQSPLYGVDLLMADKPIHIDHSCLRLDSTLFYSSRNDNPLLATGTVDFSNFDHILLDLAFKAHNFEIVNSPRTKQSVVFGQIYSDLNATVKGTTDFLRVKGKLKVLKGTQMTYVMTDGPLAVEDQLSGLVEFVDFSDTTKTDTVESIQPPSGVFVDMAISISNAAKLHCELSADNESYFDCRGGGNLNLKYFPSGDISLIGRYTLSSGELKYALPFIPLKTFKLTGDNYIAFNGEASNPILHITAMETTRASVNDEGSNTRMVSFNVGVQITQTLSDMGLQFLIEAPEDMNVQNELASMSAEEKNKVAISLIATGMYLTSTNKSSFKANNALNSFLQSQIQNIAGQALKSIDLSVGVEGSTTASGNAQTDYSFQFSKHLWNDRVTFIIGGKVSAGSSNAQENQSFIDNISLEYRLNQEASRYVRLFYDHDTQDPLEGQYSSAGAGLVLRRKFTNFREIILWKRRKATSAPQGVNVIPVSSNP